MLHDVVSALQGWSDGAEGSAGAPLKAAIATVVQVHGSAPLPRGTVMAVREDGAVVGAVSGGCVEQQVIDAARAVAAGGDARRLRFAPDADPLIDSGLPCGGGIDVLIEAWAPSAAQRRFARAVLDGVPATLRSEAAGDAGLVLHEAAARRRLVLVGAGLVAEAVAELASGLAWEVVIVDPREAFVERAGALAKAQVLAQWPRQAIAGLGLAAADAVIALSHHPALDDEALEAALATEVGFVGVLGARRSHAERLHRLRARGLDERALARVVGPVGLDLGGWLPREVAVAIVGELVAVQHGRGGGRLATARGPIHPIAGSPEGEPPAATFGSLRAPADTR